MNLLKALFIKVCLLLTVCSAQAQWNDLEVSQFVEDGVLTFVVTNTGDATLEFHYIIIQDELLGVHDGNASLAAGSSMNIKLICPNADCDRYELTFTIIDSDGASSNFQIGKRTLDSNLIMIAR